MMLFYLFFYLFLIIILLFVFFLCNGSMFYLLILIFAMYMYISVFFLLCCLIVKKVMKFINSFLFLFICFYSFDLLSFNMLFLYYMVYFILFICFYFFVFKYCSVFVFDCLVFFGSHLCKPTKPFNWDEWFLSISETVPTLQSFKVENYFSFKYWLSFEVFEQDYDSALAEAMISSFLFVSICMVHCGDLNFTDEVFKKGDIKDYVCSLSFDSDYFYLFKSFKESEEKYLKSLAEGSLGFRDYPLELYPFPDFYYLGSKLNLSSELIFLSHLFTDLESCANSSGEVVVYFTESDSHYFTGIKVISSGSINFGLTNQGDKNFLCGYPFNAFYYNIGFCSFFMNDLFCWEYYMALLIFSFSFVNSIDLLYHNHNKDNLFSIVNEGPSSPKSHDSNLKLYSWLDSGYLISTCDIYLVCSYILEFGKDVYIFHGYGLGIVSSSENFYDYLVSNNLDLSFFSSFDSSSLNSSNFLIVFDSVQKDIDPSKVIYIDMSLSSVYVFLDYSVGKFYNITMQSALPKDGDIGLMFLCKCVLVEEFSSSFYNLSTCFEDQFSCFFYPVKSVHRSFGSVEKFFYLGSVDSMEFLNVYHNVSSPLLGLGDGFENSRSAMLFMYSIFGVNTLCFFSVESGKFFSFNNVWESETSDLGNIFLDQAEESALTASSYVSMFGSVVLGNELCDVDNKLSFSNSVVLSENSVFFVEMGGSGNYFFDYRFSVVDHSVFIASYNKGVVKSVEEVNIISALFMVLSHVCSSFTYISYGDMGEFILKYNKNRYKKPGNIDFVSSTSSSLVLSNRFLVFNYSISDFNKDVLDCIHYGSYESTVSSKPVYNLFDDEMFDFFLDNFSGIDSKSWFQNSCWLAELEKVSESDFVNFMGFYGYLCFWSSKFLYFDNFVYDSLNDEFNFIDESNPVYCYYFSLSKLTYFKEVSSSFFNNLISFIKDSFMYLLDTLVEKGLKDDFINMFSGIWESSPMFSMDSEIETKHKGVMESFVVNELPSVDEEVSEFKNLNELVQFFVKDVEEDEDSFSEQDLIDMSPSKHHPSEEEDATPKSTEENN